LFDKKINNDTKILAELLATKAALLYAPIAATRFPEANKVMAYFPVAFCSSVDTLWLIQYTIIRL